MRIVISLLGLIFSSMIYSAVTLPAACQPLPVEGQTVTLKTKKAHLVLVHNVSQTDLWVTHPVTNPSASAGWSSRLQTKHWSALVVNQSPFELSCIESKPGHEQQIPCAGAITLCQWKGGKVPTRGHSTFWAAENMSLPALKIALVGRGFALEKKTTE